MPTIMGLFSVSGNNFTVNDVYYYCNAWWKSLFTYNMELKQPMCSKNWLNKTKQSAFAIFYKTVNFK